VGPSLGVSSVVSCFTVHLTLYLDQAIIAGTFVEDTGYSGQTSMTFAFE
jgi:hypothetical protein